MPTDNSMMVDDQSGLWIPPPHPMTIEEYRKWIQELMKPIIDKVTNVNLR